MTHEYTAIIKQTGKWWIGWIEEVPGVNCQESTQEALMESLKITLEENFMTQVELLERNIMELDDNSFSQLRDWLIEFDQARWDKKLESDSNAGKLDFLINAALAEHRAGKTKDL